MSYSETKASPNEAHLTTTQRKTLRELTRFIDERGLPPTVEELAQRLQMTRAIVQGCLDKLIQKGHLRKTHGKARGLELVRAPQTTSFRMVTVPLLGSAPAGLPINTDECRSGEVFVSANIVGNEECFALSIVGDSMQGAEIFDGDIIIVRKQPLAEHGDIVVASIDGEVTVKRLAIKEGRIRLLPENSQFAPIEIGANTELRVMGKVIASGRSSARQMSDEQSSGSS